MKNACILEQPSSFNQTSLLVTPVIYINFLLASPILRSKLRIYSATLEECEYPHLLSAKIA